MSPFFLSVNKSVHTYSEFVPGLFMGFGYLFLFFLDSFPIAFSGRIFFEAGSVSARFCFSVDFIFDRSIRSGSDFRQ
ncbi:hypothetical protein LEP1GSC005_2325 [Leptospira santarosai str. ST188]|nr:hypothetical protein LEP1GSC005_2325 [Leptospira santarosai str. ST188]